jgi:hypothetical protein
MKNTQLNSGDLACTTSMISAQAFFCGDATKVAMAFPPRLKN